MKREVGIGRMYKVPNARMRELYGVKKGLDERIHDACRHYGGGKRCCVININKLIY